MYSWLCVCVGIQKLILLEPATRKKKNDED